VSLTAAGGSRAWRATVAFVLARDAYTCHMIRNGAPCGHPATTANHIIPRRFGGSDEPDNLEAACAPCNYSEGAKIRHAAAAALIVSDRVIADLAELLDAAGVPHDAPRHVILRWLHHRGSHPYRNSEIDATVRYRRARGPLYRI